MSTLPNRTHLKSVLLLAILLPLVSLSQVKIKEKVEIGPKMNRVWDVGTELKMVFHWDAGKTPGSTYYPMHFQVYEPNGDLKGFDEIADTSVGNYTETITFVDDYQYGGQAVYINSNAYGGWYELNAIADTSTRIIPDWLYYVEIYVSGQLDTTIQFDYHEFYPEPGTRYTVNWTEYDFEGPVAPPCSGVLFQFSDLPDLQYGQTGYVGAQIVDSCGATIYDPPEHYFKFELLGDTTMGFLRDVDRGKTGTMLDSVSSTSIEFDAWGTEPQASTQVSVRISAENGSISPATATFNVLPPQMKAIAGKTTLTYGDTTSLKFQVRDVGGSWTNIPDGWWAKGQIVQADTFGFLYTVDSSQVGNALDGWFSALNYYAKPESEPDSIGVLIQLVSQEPVIFPMVARQTTIPKTAAQVMSKEPKISAMSTGQIVLQEAAAQKRKARSQHAKLSTRVAKKPTTKILGGSIPGGNMDYGLVRLKVKKNLLRILDHAPWTIWPYLPPQSNGYSRGADRPGYNPKRGFRIQVLGASNQPMRGQDVCVATKFEVRSGGHEHSFGKVELDDPTKQGFFYGQSELKKNPIVLTTDGNGMAVVDSMVASQVSGKYLITASLVADSTVKDTVNLEVRVPGLVNLVDYQDESFTFAQSDTGRANHPDNAWCAQIVVDSLSAGTWGFYEWTKSQKAGGKGIKTSINDLSLPWGGLFDIDARWNIDDPSHSFHRVGLSVDVNGGGLDSNQVSHLTKFMKDNGGQRYREGPIHYGFNGGK